jgi:hypothetical protein
MAQAHAAEYSHNFSHSKELIRSDDYTHKVEFIATELERKGYFKDAGFLHEQLGDIKAAEEAYSKGGLANEVELLRKSYPELKD